MPSETVDLVELWQLSCFAARSTTLNRTLQLLHAFWKSWPALNKFQSKISEFFCWHQTWSSRIEHGDLSAKNLDFQSRVQKEKSKPRLFLMFLLELQNYFEVQLIPLSTWDSTKPILGFWSFEISMNNQGDNFVDHEWILDFFSGFKTSRDARSYPSKTSKTI